MIRQRFGKSDKTQRGAARAAAAHGSHLSQHTVTGVKGSHGTRAALRLRWFAGTYLLRTATTSLQRWVRGSRGLFWLHVTPDTQNITLDWHCWLCSSLTTFVQRMHKQTESALSARSTTLHPSQQEGTKANAEEERGRARLECKEGHLFFCFQGLPHGPKYCVCVRERVSECRCVAVSARVDAAACLREGADREPHYRGHS